MTHPLTPREKVEPCFECGSTERIGTACAPCNPDLTALASGSGDQAELEVVATVVSAYGDPEAFGERIINVVTNLSRIPYRTDLVTATSAQALLAENAALRAERVHLVEQKEGTEDALFNALSRATEVERKLAEAVSIVRLLFEAFPKTKPRESDESEPSALRTARAFLSKEALA